MHHDFILDNEKNTAYGSHKLNPTETVSSDVGSYGRCGGEVDYKAGAGQSGQRPVANGIIAYSHGCQCVIVLYPCSWGWARLVGPMQWGDNSPHHDSEFDWLMIVASAVLRSRYIDIGHRKPPLRQLIPQNSYKIPLKISGSLHWSGSAPRSNGLLLVTLPTPQRI